MAIRASEAIYNARNLIKDHFGAPSEENVIFTYNATYAINMAIKCFVKKPSTVLISDMEHNAVYRPVIAESLKGNINYRIFSTFGGDEEKILADIAKKTTYRTSAIICIGASNICNIKLPIEKIGKYAKDKGLLFILDASQLAGHAKIDMEKMGISILCAPGHKGLYGPQGCGFFIVGNNITAHSTLLEGGSGFNSKEITMPSTLPERLEAGTLSTPAAVGIASALEYLNYAGMDNIIDYEHSLGIMMRQIFSSYREIELHGDIGDGCVFSITSQRHDTQELADMLNEEGIMVRAGLHCAPLAHKTLGTLDQGTVRFSAGIFNTERDLDILDKALRKIFA